MRRKAYVIVWPNPATGLDEFWAGDEDAEPTWQFDGLGTAYQFPDKELAETAMEQLGEALPSAMFQGLRVKPVTMTYHGKGKP